MGNDRHRKTPVRGVLVGSDEERREIARTLNADRRHLTEEQRRAVVIELAREGHSNRAIAGAVGYSEGQVRKDIAGEELRTDTQLKPDRVKGLDGKIRPAHRPTVAAAKNAHPSEPLWGSEEAGTAEAVRGAEGHLAAP
jgi:hypothetical protein